MFDDGRRRVVIEGVKPEINCGRFPIKRVVGEKVTVEADIFCDGHDEIAALLLYRNGDEETWREVPMLAVGNDRWQGSFIPEKEGTCRYAVEGWADTFRTWRKDLRKRFEAGQKLDTDLAVGGALLRHAATLATAEHRELLEKWAQELSAEGDRTLAARLALSDDLAALMELYPDRRFATVYDKELTVRVDRKRALFSAWYEMFPRSTACEPGKHGTFADCARLLPEIAEMGFDVLYLPPIHPIGKTNRKGKNNNPSCEPGEPGCPWAIGAEEGGHKALHPDLGTVEDFRRLIALGKQLGVELAMDIAYQCAPDHPYVAGHKGWFRWRPDGTIQYA
ncbi:MAG TPA: maltotransferase domain-containing protein, partial [Verrucomicrobiae bacterium]|nr:maltotransferase domain-containing protein [Verrucomicrobiae bacterium]